MISLSFGQYCQKLFLEGRLRMSPPKFELFLIFLNFLGLQRLVSTKRLKLPALEKTRRNLTHRLPTSLISSIPRFLSEFITKKRQYLFYLFQDFSQLLFYNTLPCFFPIQKLISSSINYRRKFLVCNYYFQHLVKGRTKSFTQPL